MSIISARFRILAALVIFASALTGCGRDSSATFVGTWHRPKYPNQMILIKDEGGGKISVVNAGTEKYLSGTRLGQIKGDSVVFDQFTMSFKSDGVLVFANDEFIK
jgi:hypothetical protein